MSVTISTLLTLFLAINNINCSNKIKNFRIIWKDMMKLNNDDLHQQNARSVINCIHICSKIDSFFSFTFVPDLDPSCRCMKKWGYGKLVEHKNAVVYQTKK